MTGNTASPAGSRRSRHILATPTDTTPREVAILADTRWRSSYRDDAGHLVLSKYSHVDGPAADRADSAQSVSFPPNLTQVFVATTLRERGDPPFPGSPDPTGVGRAFPYGMPIREEARVVDWLVAAARRLGGAVHLDNSGVVLVPRADAAVDLTVYSNLWLVPGAALSLVKMIDPTFRPAMEFQRWAGPGGGPLAAASQGAAIDLPSELRADLHRRADAYDARALSQEPVVDRYALRADLGPAGTVWLEVEGVEVPEALRRLPWTESGVVSYGLHWDPADPANLLAEFPSPAQRAERVAAAALLARLALAIHSATGLEILDADAFPVDAADL